MGNKASKSLRCRRSATRTATRPHSRVLDRFPELQIVSAENNWAGFLLPAADGPHLRAPANRPRLREPAKAEPILPVPDVGDLYRRLRRRRQPPLYRRRQVDVVLRLSAPGLVLAASQEVVARDFKDASAEDKFKITHGKAARLYGFDA